VDHSQFDLIEVGDFVGDGFGVRVELPNQRRSLVLKKGNNLKRFKDVYLKAKAGIWP